MKELGKNFFELVVLPSIDDDVDTGVEDKKEVGESHQDVTPEDKDMVDYVMLGCYSQLKEKKHNKTFPQSKYF